ncbi:MAG: 50S ribosomal protein L11 [Thermoplasmata archaeon]|nr:50S ribosomal protein L11 [Euryarchaeota archaeon]RLF65725.1 MAG: 50S ribosomal protein L11 [Thermoplasmata archaeon]
MPKQVVEVLVEGGKATPGPPLGPALGPLGVNVAQVVKAINEATKAFEGMKVPVKIIVDVATRQFEIEVGTPPTSALILKELGAEKGSSDPKRTKIGDLSLEQIIKIAKIKKKDMLSYTLKSAVKEVLGTCVSMGVTVMGKDPREVQRMIDNGEIEIPEE